MRIAGINIPDEKQVGAGLTAIFGVGRSQSRRILNKLNIEEQKTIKKLTAEEQSKIRTEIEKLSIEGDLRTETQRNIKHNINVASYRGQRHQKKLPVRGQRTKTNARTKRGKRVTVGSGRKPPAQKT